jgi:hypothetical protein
MRSLLPVGVFLLLVSSCSNDKTDDEVFVSFNESLENSNRALNQSTSSTEAILENKSFEPETREKANIWLPMVERVRSVSSALFNQLEELKLKTRNDPGSVFLSIQEFEGRLDSITPIFAEVLQHYTVLPSNFPVKNEKEFQKLIYSGSPVKSATLLSQLQNHVKVIEHRLVADCNDQVGSMGKWFSYILPLINQSHGVVTPGETIELKAGVGAFTRSSFPKITIANKEMNLDEGGQVRYRFNAPKKPGKYQKQVRVEYTDQDGKKQFITKSITYSVIDCN